MALATNTTIGTIYLNGDFHTSNDALAPELTATGVVAGIYNFPDIVVDIKGRTLYLREATVDDVPCATNTSCGVVKVGGTLNVDVNGKVDMNIATTNSLGMIQPDGSFTLNGSLLSLQQPIATVSSLGTIIVGANLGIDANGILVRSASSQGDATTSAKGLVQIGSGINVAAGIISAVEGTNATKGIINSADTNNITITTGSVDIGTNIGVKNTAQIWTAAQNGAMQSLTNIIGSLTLDAANYSVFDIVASGDITLNNIINLAPNQQVDIIMHLGDLVTEYNLTFNNTFFKISGNTTARQTTLISVVEITNNSTQYGYTIVQPYMV